VEDVLLAIGRKVVFAVLVVGGFILFDKYYLKGFNTWEVLKNDPKAIAILLAGFIVSLAFA
jgi:hypothetical protein